MNKNLLFLYGACQITFRRLWNIITGKLRSELADKEYNKVHLKFSGLFIGAGAYGIVVGLGNALISLGF